MNIKIYDSLRRNAPTSGYGLMAYQFGERLKKYGHIVRYFDEDRVSEADIHLWIRPPHYIKEAYFDPNKLNVFFTMHESETFLGWKSDWPALLNKCKAVIVPTEWNKKVFAKSGVTVPLYTVPLGVDDRIFIGYKHSRYSVLSVFDGLGSDSSRDDWRGMIRAFYKAFYDHKHTKVVYSIKSWRIDYDKYQKFLEDTISSFGYKRHLLPVVSVHELDLTPADMNLFYSRHHSFVKASAGEGWSLPTLEALSSGLKIISKRTPAMLTYLNEDNADFFETEDQLANVFREHYKVYKKQKAVSSLWSWREAAKKLDLVLREIQNNG